MAYPDGTVPTEQTVHPTPIYETLAMGLGAWMLWQLRDRFRAGVLFAIYLLYAGAERFLIEFLRRNDDAVLGLTTAQLESLAMMLDRRRLDPCRESADTVAWPRAIGPAGGAA